MVRILLEPKNSIVRQYQKLFELDGVDPVSYTHLDVYKRQISHHNPPCPQEKPAVS